MKKVFLFSVVLVALSGCQKDHYDVIISQAKLYDGLGNAPIVTDVGIRADTIAFIGDLSGAAAPIIIDAKGLALAPGFIDAHSHHDRGMFGIRDMPACVSQGITTIVVGQDGGSEFPLNNFFKEIEATPVAVNVASYSGHNTLRDSVIIGNYQRVSSQAEIEQMKQMLRLDMEAGALGLSTGLEYDPGIFSDPAEVIELAKVAAEFNGRYISHIRSEDRYFWKAIDEIINIGKVTQMPVQISHTKLAMKSIWGQSEQLIKKLDSARAAGVNLTADIYPYTYWSSTMTVLFPERNFKDRKEAEFALSELTTPEGLLIGNYSPDTSYIGKTLAEVSALRKTDAPKTLMDLIAEVESKNGDESIITTSMAEQDLATIMKWPYAGICSDGSGVGRHPRGYGAFSRVMRSYVRESKILTMEEAIRKMTSLTADNLGIRKRGRIAVGQFADLVLFDPEKISDQATPEKPQLPSVGISNVWVNGKEVFAMGKTTKVYPGKIIRREK
ncbi:MAG TPA: D-aminoacylase [Cyclobacteriaceae bacterium]|nr:D-aminoacylase [Cyclobacteriaceae bacterium]